MLTRRELLRASVVASGLVVAGPRGALARPAASIDAYGTSRLSRLAPRHRLVHADLHNHSLLSDGDGDPAAAFESMRLAGLDVAALTDHSTLNDGLPESLCLPVGLLDPSLHAECMSVAGIHEGSWAELAELVAAASVRDEFLALRGFEWSSPTLGHMNVWFSQDFTDPAHTGGAGTPDDLLRFMTGEGAPVPVEVVAALDELVRTTPAAGLGMPAWYAWLAAQPGSPGLGGGADGIFGFNHPGREAGRFSGFDFAPSLVDRCVSLELFNRREDYLFERTDDLGLASPLVACLDAGWRPGILGVTDEHGTDHGVPDGKGRAGLFVETLDESGIREAMLARRFFATTLKGLRLFVTANGAPMGSTLGHTAGRVEVVVDIDRGESWVGRTLGVQVLATGSPLPTVVAAETITVPRSPGPLPRVRFDHDVADGRWLVVRVTDPSLPADGRADDTYRGFGAAIAYASPVYLDPDAAAGASASVGDALALRAAAASSPGAAPALTGEPLPATGGGKAALGLAALAGAGLLALRGRQGHDHTHDDAGDDHTH